MKFKKVEEIKKWCKEHKLDLRDFGFYALGFGVGIGAPILVDRIIYNGKARLSFDGSKDCFEIGIQKQCRFGNGYTKANGIRYRIDSLDSAENYFKECFEDLRKLIES